MQVTLPFPPKELNPNQRNHWSVLARAKKRYRELCWVLALKAGLTPEAVKGWEAADVHLNFYPPDRRGRDGDNMLAAMKAGIDGLADAVGMDDKHFKVTFDVSDDIGGMVKVSISKREPKQ
jgi:crossover junction endodeoxyribonuclease RusA